MQKIILSKQEVIEKKWRRQLYLRQLETLRKAGYTHGQACNLMWHLFGKAMR